MKKATTGFTIVELLIVIVVIAILTAIAIVAYNGVQDRANDSAVQSDIANFGKKLQLFKVDNGRYPNTYAEVNALLTGISSSAYRIHGNGLQYCYDPAANSVAVGGESKSGNAYVFKNGSIMSVNPWQTNRPGLTICGNSHIGVPMMSGTHTAWRNPNNAHWSFHTYP